RGAGPAQPGPAGRGAGEWRGVFVLDPAGGAGGDPFLPDQLADVGRRRGPRHRGAGAAGGGGDVSGAAAPSRTRAASRRTSSAARPGRSTVSGDRRRGGRSPGATLRPCPRSGRWTATKRGGSGPCTSHPRGGPAKSTGRPFRWRRASKGASSAGRGGTS